MSFYQIQSVLWARRALILLVAAITVAASLVTIMVLPDTYKASSALILNYKGADPLTGNGSPGQSSSGYLPTYLSTQLEIIKSPAVAERVVQSLGPALLPTYRDRFNDGHAPGSGNKAVGERLLRQLQVKPSRESSVITITFSGPDPREAARVANAFANEYRRFNAALEAGPAQIASTYFETQLGDAGRALEAALDNMAKFQQANGIVTQLVGADVDSLRLNELGNQLVTAQAQRMEASSRRRQLAAAEAAESPDITNNPLIQALKIDLSKARVKYQSLSRRFTPDHPTALAAAAEIGSIQTELAQQTGIASKAVVHTAAILTHREQELQSAFDEQKARMFELNHRRTALTMLTKQVESLQRAYDTIAQRLAQTRLQGQSTQSDIGLLNLAMVPQAPSGPTFPMTLAIGALAGLLLGTGVALAREMADRRLRTVVDIQALIGLPVLSTIPALSPGRLAPAKRHLAYQAAL